MLPSAGAVKKGDEKLTMKTDPKDPSTSNMKREDVEIPSSNEQSTSQPLSDRQAKTHAEFIDMRIQDTVAAGFQVMQSDWKRQGEKFKNVEEQIVSMRVDVQKNNAIPAQVRSLKNEFGLLQSSLSTIKNEVIQIKSDLSSLCEEGTNTRADIQTTKSTVVSLKGDTGELKADTHTLKSKVVANTVTTVAVQSQVSNVLENNLNIGHELKTLKTDVVLLHGNLITIKTDVAAVKKDLVGIKSNLTCISTSIDNLSRMIVGRQLGELSMAQGDSNVHVKTDSEGDDVAVGVQSETVASTSRQEGTDSDLNTSEVTFKPGSMITYERTEKRENLLV